MQVVDRLLYSYISAPHESESVRCAIALAENIVNQFFDLDNANKLKPSHESTIATISV